MADLKDAFPSELGSRTDCQPRLISSIEHVLTLPHTQKLLNSLGIPCKVFYNSLEAHRYREQADLHDVWAQLPPGSGRGPLHLLLRRQGRHLDEREASWSLPLRGGGRAPLMHLFIPRCGDPDEHQSPEMKRETPGGREAIPLRCRSRMVSQLTLCPTGTPMQPRVFNALQKMLRMRIPF